MDMKDKQSNKTAVLGIGSSGCRIANDIAAEQPNIDFYAVDTDIQELARLQIQTVQIGQNTAKGESTASKAEMGRDSALEDEHRLEAIVSQYDLIYLVSGMGAGVGTGATSVLAKIIKKHKKGCVVVLSTPFLFEGKRRFRNANQGIEEVRKNMDICCIFDNQDLITSFKDCTFRESFILIDRIMKIALNGLFTLQTQYPNYWKDRPQGHRFASIGIAQTNTYTSIDHALLQAMKVSPTQDNDFSKIYIHILSSTDHTNQCTDIAKQFVATQADVICHFEQQESKQDDSKIIVLSIQNQIQEQRITPVLRTEPPKIIKAVGSDDHGVGGSFSIENIRPRLWKPFLLKREEPPNDDLEKSSDDQR